MRVNTAVGEVGLNAPDMPLVVLRPSLLAMSKLGDGEELVTLFSVVMGDPEHDAGPNPLTTHPVTLGLGIALANRRNREYQNDHFLTCCRVLDACAPDDVDLSPYTGTMGERWGTWRPGLMLPGEVTLLARHLLEHGLVGRVRQRKPVSSNNYASAIYPAEFASAAIADLGMSEEEAWGLTMTGFSTAMHAKFAKPGEGPPTEEEHDHVMAWLESINSVRDAHLRAK